MKKIVLAVVVATLLLLGGVYGVTFTASAEELTETYTYTVSINNAGNEISATKSAIVPADAKVVVRSYYAEYLDGDYTYYYLNLVLYSDKPFTTGYDEHWNESYYSNGIYYKDVNGFITCCKTSKADFSYNGLINTSTFTTREAAEAAEDADLIKFAELLPDENGEEVFNVPVGDIIEELPDELPIDCDLNDYANYIDGYKFSGFTSDYSINAAWNGLLYPDDMNTTYIQEERVYVRIGYATTSQPTQQVLTKFLPFYVNAYDNKMSVDLSKYQPEDGYIIRSVSFIPCMYYSVYNSTLDADLAHWHYGSIATVWFNPDTSGSDIDTDTGNINHNDYSATNLPGSSELSSVDGGIAEFVNIMGNVLDSLSSFADFVTHIFGFLPWWARDLIGGVIIACVILRIAGR